ncbi:MAG: magnesium transporter [Syntrophales bacterium]|nr:magnesium transporter [Syntrophales bacterium]
MQATDILSLKSSIEEMLNRHDWQGLKDLLVQFPEQDVADLIPEIHEEKRLFILRLLPTGFLPKVFTHLDRRLKDNILKFLTAEENRTILAGMTPDDRTDFLEELPGTAIQKLLTLLTPEERRTTLQLLGYPVESVGRIMTPDYIAVRPEWSVGEALSHVRWKGKDCETVNVIYVVDGDWKLVGVLGLRRLILADPDESIARIMEKAVISVSAFDNREEGVRRIRRYDIIALPVVDAKGVMLGMVTIDDLFDVAEEETTEDFQKSAAVNPLRGGFRESSVLSLYGKRILWLSGLFGVSVLTTAMISSEREILTSTIALASFIPLLIGAGGNTGAQSSTLMVRAMSQGEMIGSQWRKALLREVIIGCLLGCTMGAASLLLGLLQGGWILAAIVSLTMACIVVFSSIFGILLPLILHRMHLDPAVASSPLIASVMDIMGLAIYFFIATRLL